MFIYIFLCPLTHSEAEWTNISDVGAEGPRSSPFTSLVLQFFLNVLWRLCEVSDALEGQMLGYKTHNKGACFYDPFQDDAKSRC